MAGRGAKLPKVPELSGYVACGCGCGCALLGKSSQGWSPQKVRSCWLPSMKPTRGRGAPFRSERLVLLGASRCTVDEIGACEHVCAVSWANGTPLVWVFAGAFMIVSLASAAESSSIAAEGRIGSSVCDARICAAVCAGSWRSHAERPIESS
eukprot:1215618-Pleurochrysis_carterae.AAC.2